MDYQAPQAIASDCNTSQAIAYNNPDKLGLDPSSYLIKNPTIIIRETAATSIAESWLSGRSLGISIKDYEVAQIWGQYAKEIGVKSATACLYIF